MTKEAVFILLALLAGHGLLAQHQQLPIDSSGTALHRSLVNQNWDVQINELMAVNNATITDALGEYDDWIEIHNFGDEPVDLNLAFITDDPGNPMQHQLLEETPGELIIPAGEFILLWADGQPEQGATHLNFSLSGSGEYVGLYDPEEVLLIDAITFGQQVSDVSFGRVLEGDQWNYYPQPTPGEANSTEGLFQIVAAPLFSVNNAFFTSFETIAITCPTADASIYYTTDGSAPTESSIPYTEAFVISETTTLRARAFLADALPSRVATNTYIDAGEFDLDVISLVTDSINLWGSSGIYDNRHSGIEKPVHIEYFKPDGTLAFEVDGGVKIHAPDTRPQQSLRLYARSVYGDKRIEYPVFDDKDVDWFKRLVLRNGANDGQQINRTHFRDCLAHELFSEMNDDNIYAASRPVNVYLNGEYWGIYNLRERQDKHFIKSNYGYTDVDFLERVATTSDSRDVIAGDWEAYDEMRDYIMENDMAEELHYAEIESRIDIRNYVDYMVTEIWTANRDWLTNNIKYYKPRNNDEAKWKWVLWDTEYGMGCYPANDHGNPNFDALHMSMSWGGWPPHWGTTTSTYMMHNLVDNPSFVQYFITRHADLLNSHLRTDRVIDRINDFEQRYATDMPRQVDRWGGTISNWEAAINGFQSWVTPRASFCREHIMNKWDHIIDEHIITLNVQPENAGYIKVNTIFTDDNPWSGFYFEGVPVNLTAVAFPGYSFVEWIEPSTTNDSLEVWLESDSTLTALFEFDNAAIPEIVINEINYNSAPFLDTGDWVELTNNSEIPAVLDGWQLRDGNDNHIYEFPAGTVLQPGSFLIACSNPAAFIPFHPTLPYVYGPVGFNLSSNGELVRLYNSQQELMDYVDYGVTAPWPSSPNGEGKTLELIDPDYDNTLPENWFAQIEYGGSPGVANNFITSVNELNTLMGYAYPNPSEDQFNIQLKGQFYGAHFKIFNTLGRLVLNGEANASSFVIDLSDQPKGMYFMQLNTDSQQSTLRLLKK